MSIEILMPALSPTMSEGKLTKWLVAEGDRIKAGDLLAEIETDKAIMEFESSEDGVLKKILVPEGDVDINVNQPIAILETTQPSITKKGQSTKPSTSVNSPKNSEPKPIDEQKDNLNDKNGGTRSLTSVNEKIQNSARVKISPIAKKMAEKLNLNLANITGSGPGGRIVKADIEDQKQKVRQSEISSFATNVEDNNSKKNLGSAEYVKLTPMRKTIAERLTLAKRDIPHFYLRRKARVDKLIEARTILNKSLESKGIRISLNDIIIKAVAQALLINPECNVCWGGDHLIKEKIADVAIAVAIEDGLLTPVVRNVGEKSLTQVSAETKNLIQRSKEKKLLPTEFSGGTITISNLGMMGINSFDAIINPPQGSILAIGATEIVPHYDETGNVKKTTIMNFTLSVDHRAIDGAVGAKFLGSIVAFLEEPISLLSYM